jgi:hypothetical protein
VKQTVISLYNIKLKNIMTTETYNRIKTAASQMSNDSLLGANVRRILQEANALEALNSYNSKENTSQVTLDEMINEVEIENRGDANRL